MFPLAIGLIVADFFSLQAITSLWSAKSDTAVLAGTVLFIANLLLHYFIALNIYKKLK